MVDKFGRPLEIPHGEFPSVDTVQPVPSATAQGMDIDFESDVPRFIKERLPLWGFNEFGKALEDIGRNLSFSKAIEQLTRIYYTLPVWDIGRKDRGTLIHRVHEKINAVLDRVDGSNGWVRVTIENAGELKEPQKKEQSLVVDARGFKPEGTDPLRTLSCYLDHAHRMGWRNFILYRVGGQRGIGMGMGSG